MGFSSWRVSMEWLSFPVCAACLPVGRAGESQVRLAVFNDVLRFSSNGNWQVAAWIVSLRPIGIGRSDEW